jgi:hypothetical protein
MPKVSPIQTNFNGGEFSPRTHGRVDADRYRSGLDESENFLPTLQGGLLKRSGSVYVAEVKDSTKKVRLQRFEFSVEQTYVIEFGDQYIRFYTNGGQLLSASLPYEISSPYLEADLFDLKFTQSADVLYIVHPDYKPRTLVRNSATNWTLSEMTFTDGPYLPINTTSTTLNPAATSGSGVTVTASSTTGINGGDGFQTTDVGRMIRIKGTGDWGWGRIASRASTTSITVDIVDAFSSTGATVNWRLGVWSDTTGWPACTTFHEDRLGFAGATNFPQRMDFSVSSDYTNFSPTAFDGTVVDSDAINFTLNATGVNAVRWLISDEKGLLAGTVAGEWIVRPSSQAEALTPTNVTAKRSTTFGSANIQAEQIGNAGIFVQRSGRKVRELTYFFESDGFRAVDLTVLAEHVTESGIVQMGQQNEPQPTIWCVRTDGELAACTYERNVDSFRASWHRHILGGQSDAAGTKSIVESVAVIPAQDGSRDEVWIVVNRWIDGGTKRYVEYFSRDFEDEVEQKDGFFVDSGLTYDAPLTITAATKANPVVITSASHGLSNGDKVLISGVKGMTELNGNSYLIANSTTNTFELTDLSGTNIDGTSFSTYVSGGEVREFISTISGLDHLDGETVDIAADGAVQPTKVVSSGSVTLSNSATTVHVGLNYKAKGKMLRLNAGSADGTAIGKTQRTHRVAFMLHRSLGLKVGFNGFDDLTEFTFRKASDKLTRAPGLFTGIRSDTVEADYDFDNQLSWQSDQPLPLMILAIAPQMHTQDR